MSKLAYQRLDDLLELLIKRSDYVSMHEFTTTFLVSDRTIRTDINNLNDTLKNVGATVTLARGKGYFLDIIDKATFTTWWKHSLTSSKIVLNSIEERQAFLIFTLFKESKPLSLEDFLEQLYVSKNTFYTYLKTIRDAFLPYGLKIVNRPNIGFEVIGSEFSKRQAISELLIGKDLQEYLVGFTETELALFDSIDLDLLKTIELASLAPLGLLDSDYYHKNILSHFALALSRIRENKPLIEFPIKVPTINNTAMTSMNLFFSQIEASFELILTKPERDYFIYYLSLNAPRLVETEAELEQSNAIAQDIVEELLGIIKKTSNFDWLKDETLIRDLTSHIEGFINMNLMDAGRSNPLLKTIKKSFPLAYDLCVTHLETLGIKYGLYFSDAEIGFVALHIAGAIERSTISNHRKYRVILICGTGRAMSRIIEAKINKRYPNEIEIVNRLSFIELQQQDLSEVDFVITTVPLGKITVPFIDIHMNQLDKDIEKVQAFMNQLNSKTATIFELFQKEFFFPIPELMTKEQLLVKMSRALEVRSIVPDSFFDSIWEREQISQTNINDVLAIPHPMSLISHQSRIAVAVLPNGLDWGNNETIHFVFLFAITKEDYEDTKDIYNLLLDFIEHSESQKEILVQPTFDYFIEKLKEIYP